MPSVKNTSASELLCFQIQVATVDRLLRGQLKSSEDFFDLDVSAIGSNRSLHEPGLPFEAKNVAEYLETSLKQILIVNHSQHRHQVLLLFSH